MVSNDRSPAIISGVSSPYLRMARNIEIKARIHDIEAVTKRVAQFADQGPIESEQDDTFFRCKNGRLKLRSLSSTEGKLIFYQRQNQPGPKESFYLISPTSSPNSLREALTLAYGQAGRVRKVRTLFLVGRTRVHLDKVEGLGHFFELEVILEEGESPETGIEEAHLLMDKLGVDSSQLVECAYVDLLTQRF